MARRTLLNAAVAFAAIAVAVVLAIQAVIGGSTTEASPDLIATEVEGRSAVGIESTVPTVPTVDPVPTTRPPRTTVTSAAPLPTVTLPPLPDLTVPTVTPTIPPPPPVFPGPLPDPPSVPGVVRTGPGSWSFVDQGVTVTARIEPAAPRVGDTVTLTYTASGEGDFCCMMFVYVGGVMIEQPYMPPTPCPIESVTSATTTFEATAPGPLALHVQGSRLTTLCHAPPTFLTANLHTTITVLP